MFTRETILLRSWSGKSGVSICVLASYPYLISSSHSLSILGNIKDSCVSSPKCRLQLIHIKHIGHYPLALCIVVVNKFYLVLQCWFEELLYNLKEWFKYLGRVAQNRGSNQPWIIILNYVQSDSRASHSGVEDNVQPLKLHIQTTFSSCASSEFIAIFSKLYTSCCICSFVEVKLFMDVTITNTVRPFLSR